MSSSSIMLTLVLAKISQKNVKILFISQVKNKSYSIKNIIKFVKIESKANKKSTIKDEIKKNKKKTHG